MPRTDLNPEFPRSDLARKNSPRTVLGKFSLRAPIKNSVPYFPQD